MRPNALLLLRLIGFHILSFVSMRVDLRKIRPVLRALGTGRGLTLPPRRSSQAGHRASRKRLEDAIEKSVIHRDKCVLRLPADHEEPRVVQDFEVMRDRRLRQGKPGPDLATRELPGGRELLNYVKPSGLSESLQHPDQHAIVQR
jgi:hypothetical protein